MSVIPMAWLLPAFLVDFFEALIEAACEFLEPKS